MAEAKELVRRSALQGRDHRACRVRGAPTTDDSARSARDVISAYRNTDEFVDMCVGPHVPIDGQARFLQAAAGARALLARQREGPDAPAMLRHRVGVETGARGHLHQLEEAAKRDHRKLATELDL